MTLFWNIVIGIGVLALVIFLCSFVFTLRAEKKINYMLDALEDGELNFRFRQHRFQGLSLNNALNRMRLLYDKEVKEIASQEEYFGKMLDKVQTGIIVADVRSGQIEYVNARALALLGMMSIVNIRQLGNISPKLADTFRNLAGGGEEEVSFDTDLDRRTITVSAAPDSIRGHEVTVYAFNDISGRIEENEEQSWTKLIRVLTHEIMNTVAPIASLSEALSSDKTGTYSQEDIRAGLETISVSSRGLIKFVESYRNLTRIPVPVRKTFYVRDMAENVINLSQHQNNGSGNMDTEALKVEFTYTEKSDDVLLYADEGQISRILINLIRNAIQAGATKVDITSDIDAAENVIIYVSNNGAPISEKGQEQIFVPFYTTKSEGSGIGLSVSRQIMRLHGGSLRLVRSDAKSTVFALTFR